jgi:hypothetical protein
LKDNVEAARARNRIDVRKFAVARLAPKKYGGHISHDVQGNTTLNFQPAVLVRVVGDGPASAASIQKFAPFPLATTAYIVYPPLTTLRVHWGISPSV